MSLLKKFTKSEIIVGIVMVVILIIGVCWVFSRPRDSKTAPPDDITIGDYFTPGVDHDTIYFQVEDIDGEKSFVHDSGVKPSTLQARGMSEFELSVVKLEYNEGKTRQIATPKVVTYGQQIMAMNQTFALSPQHVKDKGMYYVLTVINNGK